MLEILQIKLLGKQPIARITDKKLDEIIKREFGIQANEVKERLRDINCDNKIVNNRVVADIIKLAEKDINKLDYYMTIGKNDYRDVIAQAEYPRCLKLGFSGMKNTKMKKIYIDDWSDYSDWLFKK